MKRVIFTCTSTYFILFIYICDFIVVELQIVLLYHTKYSDTPFCIEECREKQLRVDENKRKQEKM